MSAQTADERRTQQAHARATLQRIIPSRKVSLYTLTTFGSGETDYVRIFTVRRGEIVELTYYVGVLTGLRNASKRGLAFGGGQYSKGLEAADATWRARFGEAFPQNPSWGEKPHWIEL